MFPAGRPRGGLRSSTSELGGSTDHDSVDRAERRLVGKSPVQDAHRRQFTSQTLDRIGPEVCVEPDMEVDNPPHATFRGEDAQLDAAIEYLLRKIEEEPVPVPVIPAGPVRPMRVCPLRRRTGVEPARDGVTATRWF